ncbi:MAG: S8 family serine peptidase [Planctomycetota bacterium]|nr:S8 family serine peptidase [Planctomycetota bacterium]
MNPLPKKIVAPSPNSPWGFRPMWEQCERRLALSAMPWMPWDIGPQQAVTPVLADLPQPDDLVSHPSHLQPIDTNVAPALEQHLAEAHSQSGWNQVHSQYGLTGKGQTVAVIDSGIAFDHVALGKGYGPGYKVVGGWDFAENDAKPYDDAPGGFHGTHVSGIIGANDGTHLGVAPDVDLVALRVFTDAGKGDMGWTESALKWVHEHRNSFANPITTVNLSLGSAWNSNTVPSWGTLEDELAQLQRDGIVVVASAGNSFQQYKTPGLSYPAVSPYVIPVSSVDANGQLSDFSQRDSRSIAAPGRSIESTVPDYFYGKDGIANDWSTASGTSMAAPYIAGASVLVREAMEMVGMQNISSQSIYEHLKTTAHSVWDSVTKQDYQSLDLDRAIETLLPVDTVGDTLATGMNSPIQSGWQTDGWINSLSDQDVYRLAPNQSGTVSVQLASQYVDDAVFKLFRGGQETDLHAIQGKLSFAVSAGEAVGLSIADLDSIGSYHLNWNFAASSSNGGGSGGGTNGGGANTSIPSQVADLGSVDLLEQTLSGSSRYKFIAEHTGIMSVVVDAGSQPTGTLQVLRPGITNGTLSDSLVENNQWRVDFSATQGQSIEFVLPGMASRNVHLVNLLQQQGNALTIYGTDVADSVKLDLSNGLVANVAGIAYQLDNTIKSVVLDANQNNDTLTLIGSKEAEKVDLRPGLTTLENTQITVRAIGFENVQFQGGGGPDRAYLHDAATDDRLSIWPNKAELTGVGYSFQVGQVDRIFVHADQGGDDQAFVFDSVGDDALSVRPQFTSLAGTGFFNYVAGFERVFAYSNAGGVDSAALYDSVGNDLFSTSGEVTSIVGSGFSTFARGFENVEAFSNAGGVDRASVYAPVGGKLTSGADYVGMQDMTRSSIARNFERVETFLAGQTVATPVRSNALETMSEDSAHTIEPIESMPLKMTPTMANVSANECEAVLEKMDWIANLVEKEIRQLRGGPNEAAMHAIDLLSASADGKEIGIDLTWIDPDLERAALDEIFAKHT